MSASTTIGLALPRAASRALGDSVRLGTDTADGGRLVDFTPVRHDWLARALDEAERKQAAGAVAAAGAGGPRGRAPNPFNVTLLARVWSLSEPRENKGGGQPRWGSGKHVCFKLHAGPEHDRKGDGRDACRGIADAGLLGGALAPMQRSRSPVHIRGGHL